MTTMSSHDSRRAGIVSVATIASFCSTVLAVDNLLGFVGSGLLGLGVAPVVAMVAVLAAVASVVLSAWTRDLARGVGAASVLGFLLASSPALEISLWSPLSTVVQALVPLGFAAFAGVSWRRTTRTAPRAASAVTAFCAAAWAIGAFVPLWLEVFLAVQAATLLAASVILGYPWIQRLAACLRHLWDSAEVR